MTGPSLPDTPFEAFLRGGGAGPFNRVPEEPRRVSSTGHTRVSLCLGPQLAPTRLALRSLRFARASLVGLPCAAVEPEVGILRGARGRRQGGSWRQRKLLGRSAGRGARSLVQVLGRERLRSEARIRRCSTRHLASPCRGQQLRMLDSVRGGSWWGQGCPIFREALSWKGAQWSRLAGGDFGSGAEHNDSQYLPDDGCFVKRGRIGSEAWGA